MAHLQLLVNVFPTHNSLAGWLEIAALFFLVPLLIYIEWVPTRWAIPILVLGAVGSAWGAGAAGATSPELGLARLSSSATVQCLATGLTIWAVAQGAIAVRQRTLGEAVFPFATGHPRLFLLLTCVYAISVTAQEFLFRAFFFWRYQHLAGPSTLFIINVLAFGWVHVIFRSWVSVVVTMIGGVLFTALYQEYHSLVGVCAVHMAFGLSIFAMGWGKYFYTGSVAAAQRMSRQAPSM